MPSRTEKNLIKPLADQALPLIAWRLRDVSRRESRVVLRDMPTCANCHSFSADGRTLAHGHRRPRRRQGRLRDRAAAADHPDHARPDHQLELLPGPKPRDKRTIGFLSRVSPDGRTC